MFSSIKYHSGPHCRREHQGSVEKSRDNVLVIHDITTNAHLKTLFWITMGAISLIAVLGAITSQNVLALSVLILVLLASIGFNARRISTEIDLTGGRINKSVNR